MAIVQTEAQVIPIANRVGITNERAKDIKARSTAALTLADLRAVVNSIGFYSEKADHLVAAGITFA